MNPLKLKLLRRRASKKKGDEYEKIREQLRIARKELHVLSQACNELVESKKSFRKPGETDLHTYKELCEFWRARAYCAACPFHMLSADWKSCNDIGRADVDAVNYILEEYRKDRTFLRLTTSAKELELWATGTVLYYRDKEKEHNENDD